MGFAHRRHFVGWLGRVRWVSLLPHSWLRHRAGAVGAGRGDGFRCFFSPCSFPILLTVVARQTAETESGRLRSGLRFATGASLGAAAFLLSFGLALSLGGGSIADHISFTSTGGRILRVAVGVGLIVMGLVQLGRVRLSFSRLASLAAPIERRRSAADDRDRFLNHVLYGFGYLVAGFG